MKRVILVFVFLMLMMNTTIKLSASSIGYFQSIRRVASPVLTEEGMHAFSIMMGGVSLHNQSSILAVLNPTEEGLSMMKDRFIPIFMIVMGVSMTAIWGLDIASGKFSDQGNLFRWREGENLLWPHLLAELLTSAGLVAGGTGLLTGLPWGVQVSLFSLGAVCYSAINSSGWVLAERSRMAYGIPMWVALAGSAVSFAWLIR